jgi:hypothetical protein
MDFRPLSFLNLNTHDINSNSQHFQTLENVSKQEPDLFEVEL